MGLIICTTVQAIIYAFEAKRGKPEGVSALYSLISTPKEVYVVVEMCRDNIQQAIFKPFTASNNPFCL